MVSGGFPPLPPGAPPTVPPLPLPVPEVVALDPPQPANTKKAAATGAARAIVFNITAPYSQED
jgi:hypothetical protein